MGFKTDWSFLDKISMGAVGTEAVIEQLNQIYSAFAAEEELNPAQNPN